MLIRLTIGNLYSFFSPTEFNMLVGDVRRHPHHVHKLGKVDTVRTAALYGANGAGKSNLIKALSLLQEAAISEKIPNSKISPFKLAQNSELPFSQIEVEVFLNRKYYLYGLALTPNRVAEEWLYESGLGVKPDTLIYERKTNHNGETKITFASKYEQNTKAKIRRELYENEILRNHITLLWQLNQAKEPIMEEAKFVFNWLENNLLVIHADESPEGTLDGLINDEKFQDFCREFSNSFDTGITDLVVQTEKYKESDLSHDAHLSEDILADLEIGEKNVPLQFDNGTPALVALENGELILKKLAAHHQTKNGEKVLFEFHEESDGTKKLTEFLVLFYQLKTQPNTIFIDEIERSIHPMLIQTILEKLSNEKEIKGQLLFTTHAAGLLDLSLFRQDEIWFAEKDEIGATKLYPLSDFAIRADLDIEKGYLLGRFGAVPALHDLKKLNLEKFEYAKN